MAKNSTQASANASAPARSARSRKKLAIPPVRAGYYRGESWRPDESIGYLVKQVGELLSRALETRMSDYGLTDAQWRPLLVLSRKDLANNASQISKEVGCDAGATTRMIDRLEDKGLLRRVRSTDDRRVQQLELTEEGRKIASIVPYVIADVLNAHLVDLSRAEIEQFRELLRRVIATGRREAETQMSKGDRA